MTIVRMMVLGIMAMRGTAHGYAVRQALADWEVQYWTDIKPGSIYHALKQLTKDGLLTEIGAAASPGGPGRMTYAIAPAGRAEFHRLHDLALQSVNFLELGAGIAFMQSRPRAHVIARLREQVAASRATTARLESLAPAFPDHAAPPHTADLLSLSGAVVGTVGNWVEGLILRLETGEYRMADD
jgi:DNA-binding PadR family transcriptional regulator